MQCVYELLDTVDTVVFLPNEVSISNNLLAIDGGGDTVTVTVFNILCYVKIVV